MFQVDDDLGAAIRENIALEDLQLYCEQSLDIFRCKFDDPSNGKTYKEIKCFPNLCLSWDSLMGVHNQCLDAVDSYRENVEDLILLIQRYFDIYLVSD